MLIHGCRYSLVLLASLMLIAPMPAALLAQEETPVPATAPTGPRLDFPAGLVTDGVSMYVANSRNNTIVKISMAGSAISTLAGKLFTAGSEDGPAASARFSSPDGLVLVGNSLYVVDTENSDIRKIDLATLAVTTAAGTANISGSESGHATAAHFNLPTQITADSKALYIADTGNSTIRKLTLADMMVTTIGGQPQTQGSDDGPASKSTFDHPRGVASDGRFLYVADTANQLIRKIDLSNNTTTTIAGQAKVEGMADGPGPQASFANPEAMATDGTFLYITDADNHAIRKFNLADGTLSTITQVNGHIGSGLTLSKDGKTVYFSDTTENSVQTLDVSTGNVTPLFPQSGRAP